MTPRYPNTALIVMAYPDAQWGNRAQAEWARTRFDERHVLLFPTSGHPVHCAYNTVIRDFVLPAPPSIDSVVFMEHDVTPIEASDEILQQPNLDVCGALHASKGGVGAWSLSSGFHFAMWFARRRIFHSIAPPWTQWTYTTDGCAVERCLCDYLRAKAEHHGFKTGHAGYCLHDLSHASTWLSGNGKDIFKNDSILHESVNPNNESIKAVGEAAYK
jgi:hypothetical protein